ncbi:MAG: glycyl-radical enzyme activating protein [Candidatus Lokiarchaeota archaeon]|nr:glycyl-radical enzyme activating protein [Candidatus Lokiarchaeota archaeon]
MGSNVKKNPLIVDINQNSLDDGPGIRSIIFFKGCPLSCVWCQNPEAQNPNAELLFTHEKCIHCDPCRIHCPTESIVFPLTNVGDSVDLSPNLNRDTCKLHFNCIRSCPADVFKKVGEVKEIEELLSIFKDNHVFYENTGGGVMLSGGEPLMFPEFVKELVNQLTLNEIDYCIETSGYFSFNEDTELILRNASMIYYDIKLIDPNLHRNYCGVDNKVIIENFDKIRDENVALCPQDQSHINEVREKSIPILIPRTPLIPEITTATHNLKQLHDFYTNRGINFIDFLPYNPLWIDKVEKLGMKCKYNRNTWMTEDELNIVRAMFSRFKFDSFH